MIGSGLCIRSVCLAPGTGRFPLAANSGYSCFLGTTLFWISSAIAAAAASAAAIFVCF